MKTVLLVLLRAYRFLLSPWVGNSCRFWPTCSVYSMEAIERHGALKGSYMMVTRVARCHPYSAGGVDEVPAQFGWRCWCRAGASSAVGASEATNGQAASPTVSSSTPAPQPR
jgi:putative membrane protein insertion efficiency factor